MSDKQVTWEAAVQWLRNQPDQQTLVRQCYYDDPVQAAADRFYQSEEWQAVAAQLSGQFPGRILDLGAGRGISSYAFARDGCTVVALEPDPSYLVGAGAIQALIDSSHLPIQVVQSRGETLPFADHSFDIVYGRAVLHHASDLGQLCQESSRVLKSGGVLMATREHVLSHRQDLPRFLEAHPLHWLYGGEHAYRLGDYKAAIQAAGLRIERVLGPFDSVINYSPISRAEFRADLATGLTRWIGARRGEWLSSQLWVQQLYGRYRSLKSRTPGRLYSFLAVKP